MIKLLSLIKSEGKDTTGAKMQKENIKKSCKTYFPTGFGVNKTEDGIIFLDFINQISNNDYEIFVSLAMSEVKAKQLKEALDEAINAIGE